MMNVVETMERVHIARCGHVDTILDEVEVITGKVKHAQDSVSAAFIPPRRPVAYRVHGEVQDVHSRNDQVLRMAANAFAKEGEATNLIRPGT
jgi:hypothetical protein